MADGATGTTATRAILDGRHSRRAILRGAAAMAPVLAAGGAMAQTGAGTGGDLVLRGDVSQNRYAGVRLRDFAAEATFTNPLAASVGRWDYGFIFRRTDRQRYVLVVDSTGYWTLFVDDLTPEGVFRSNPIDNRYGTLAPLRYGEGRTNTLRLETTGRVGLLRINDADVAAFRLDANTDAGDVGIVSGLFTASQRNVVVAYSGFNVLDPPPQPSAFAQRAASLLYGPANGTLYPAGADRSSLGFSNLTLRDGTVGARISVPVNLDDPSAPTAAWDCGFDLRRTPTKVHRVVVRGDGKWEMYFGTKAAADRGYSYETVVQARDDATIPLRVGTGETNDLAVQMAGATGALLVNGVKAGDLDLSRNTDPGEVVIGTNLGGYSMLGDNSAVDYEGFTVAPR